MKAFNFIIQSILIASAIFIGALAIMALYEGSYWSFIYLLTGSFGFIGIYHLEKMICK